MSKAIKPTYHNSPFYTSAGEKIARQSARNLFVEGYKFHGERVEIRLQHFLAVSLAAAKVEATPEQFTDTLAVLQMLLAHDTETATQPAPRASLPPHLERWG